MFKIKVVMIAYILKSNKIKNLIKSSFNYFGYYILFNTNFTKNTFSINRELKTFLISY